jgi:hypothetical protein
LSAFKYNKFALNQSFVPLKVSLISFIEAKELDLLFVIFGRSLTLSNPIFLPTAYSPALIYLSLPFSYKHNRTNTTHNDLFTSKYVACRETERVRPALSVGQSPYYMRKSVRQAPTAERVQQKHVGHLPTLEQNRKIMSEEVQRRIGKG